MSQHKTFGDIITDSGYNTKKTRRIVTDKRKLKNECKEANENTNIERIVELLFNTMVENEGIGLSANQIGINRKVCMINVNEPFYLVNPKIVEHDGMTPYVESCLSFPDETLKTKRHIRITVEADNFEGQLEFGPSPGEWDEADEIDINHPDMMESVALQHEIDHLNGKTFHERRIGYQEPHINESKIGRNQLVVFRNRNDLSETKVMKYKHSKSYRETEQWQLLGTKETVNEFEIDLT